VAGEGGNPAGRHPGQVQLRDAEPADLGEPVQGAEQPGGGDTGRSAAQPLQPGGAGDLIDGQQAREPLSLLLVRQCGKLGVQLLRRLLPSGRDEALEQTGTGQQHLRRDKTGGGQIDQHAGPVCRGASTGRQPAGQLGLHLGVGEVPVAVGAPDLLGVLPLGGPALGVALEHTWVFDVELGGDVGHHLLGHIGRVGQQGAEEAHRPQLDGEAEPVVRTAAGVDELPVSGVQMEVAGKLRRGQIPAVLPVGAALVASRVAHRDRPLTLLLITVILRSPWCVLLPITR